jgi:hypothetical protein
MNKISICILTILLITSNAIAADTVVMEEALNAISGLSLAKTVEEKKVACDRADSALNILEGVKGETYGKSLSQHITDLRSYECTDIDLSVTEKDDDLENFWRSAPVCRKDDEKTGHCEYNHKTGKGLFQYKQSITEHPSNTLVCAHSASESNFDVWLLANSHYNIRNRCIVSSASFPHHKHTSGMHDWLEIKGNGSPIDIPKPLYEQCKSVFNRAPYCAPTLIVANTEKKNILEVCSLTTARSLVGVFFLRVTTGFTHWKCKLVDLNKAEKEPRVLSVDESKCVPDRWGDFNKKCATPYIPRSKKVRPSSYPGRYNY